MRWRGWIVRSLQAVAVAAALALLPACSGGDPPKEALSFGSCEGLVDLADPALPVERREQLTYTCGRLRVPVDHDDPTGDTLDMQVVRVRAKDQHDRLGSVVLNFGGPGQAGLDRMSSWPGRVSGDLLSRFDLVSFDPRGVGRSAGVRCRETDPPQRPDNDLSAAAGFAAEAADTQVFVQSCTERLGARAPFVNTQQTARDLDLLRAALGEDRLTYVGLSYGAKLGAEYVRRFPDRVRAAVLDAPADPAADSVAFLEKQIAGFEQSFASYAASCPQRETCRALGAPPRAVLADLVTRAATTPIDTRKPGEDRVAYPSSLLRGVVGLLYDDASWPVLDQALAEARDDDDATAFFEIDDAFNPRPEDGQADTRHASFVISCNDTPPGVPSDATVRTALRRLAAASPVFGRWGGGSLFGCQYWSAPRAPLSLPTTTAGARVLVVGTVHDPATPYSGAVAMSRVLGARLLTFDGEGHTAVTQSACIDRWVDGFLIDLALPPGGTRCAP